MHGENDVKYDKMGQLSAEYLLESKSPCHALIIEFYNLSERSPRKCHSLPDNLDQNFYFHGIYLKINYTAIVFNET